MLFNFAIATDNNIPPDVKRHEYQNVQQKQLQRPSSYVTMKRRKSLIVMC